MLDRRKIVFTDILFDQKSEYGRRSAEGGKLDFLNKLKGVLGVKLFVIVSNDYGAAYPLTVDFTPSKLCPTGIGHSKMVLTLFGVLPIFSGKNMSYGICKIMQ